MLPRVALVFVLMLSLPVIVRAEFVIDDFSDGSFSSTTVVTANGFTIDRVITVQMGSFTYNAGTQTFDGLDMFLATMTYTVSDGATFGDVNSVLDPGSSIDGFNVGIYNGTVQNFYRARVKLDGVKKFGGTLPLGSIIFEFTDPAFSSSNMLELELGSMDVWEGHLYLGGSGNLIATPESASLLLFGLVIGAGYLVTRKQSRFAPRTDAPRTDAPRTDAPRTDADRGAINDFRLNHISLA